MYQINESAPFFRGLAQFACRCALLAFAIYGQLCSGEIWADLNSPAIGAQLPGSCVRAVSAGQCYCAAGSLLDFRRGQIERRLEFALNVTPRPLEKDVSFLDAGFLRF